MISGDPLTGRDDELAVIRRVLGGAGHHSGVVIIGAAGVGKTRLAREVLTRAHVSGDHTKWIVGTESARRLPLGAFTASLGDVMSDPLASVRRLIDSFITQQRQRRVLIGVDDAHLLDGLSAHVVHQLAQSHGVRLIVTLRAGGSEPDAVTALWKDGHLLRMDLEPLSAAATRRIIESTLGGPVDSRSCQRFWRLTDGNALFLRQMLNDQISAGRIRQVAGVWMWDEDVAVSPSIGDMVGRQLSRLTPGLALVVDTLSQCEPVAVDVLTDLVRRRDIEVAEQMHLVTVERTGKTLMARLAHPLFGELRRATAGELHLSRIRGRLAQRLAKDADPDMHATVRRALLTLESDADADPDLFLMSARYAMQLLDLDLADRFATAAAEAGAAEAPGLRAMNLVLAGRGAEAEEVLRGMHEHRWATVRAANLIWMLGRPRDAAIILERLAATHESAAEVAERTAVEACLDAVQARCEVATEKGRAALDSEAVSDFHAMMASVALIMAMGALGDVDDVTEVADAALQRAVTSFQASHMRFWFGSVYARACRLTGRIDECVRSAQQIADSANDIPGLAYANLSFLMGHAELARGAVSNAVRLLHEALAGVQKHGVTTGLRPACCFALAEAHAKLGQPAEAGEALREARECVPSDYLFMQTALSVATGWTLAADGSLSDAVATVRAATIEARERAQPTHELACLQSAAQWGDATDSERARELAGVLSLPLANAVAQHAESLRAADGEGLLAASTAYRAIGDRATAADVAAQAAACFNRAQQRKRALYASALARELSDACGGLRTPALRTPVGVPLTGREREVIELVATGLSNREIADRLVMSVRTVEGHVYRACQRVGAKSREGLAAILQSGPAR
ncbi:LuxR family transcriptional regulator [Mycobacterium celatum]|uniref:LuxR family transcriptional regulator n=1 Tax=Mycobacterium celatum TaxID=28045 RepID=A0A1X1RKH1_MYCCE|nr:LuxR family transcriptional regulator [Mycobacterium celatum]ORV08318.1 LuxR family transcriptional regulator [Mycobacterium celatum]PIB78570.1 LuxR family transcriptional regulator [Mycobacterium celatum]